MLVDCDVKGILEATDRAVLLELHASRTAWQLAFWDIGSSLRSLCCRSKHCIADKLY